MKKLIITLLVLSVNTICLGECPKADLTGDCKVDMTDLAAFASEWLLQGVIDEPGDLGMTWVYVDDPGKDFNNDGEHDGGFTGYMSKYETTNAQYCQFLNEALAREEIFVEDDVYASVGPYYRKIYYKMSDSYARIKFENGEFIVITQNEKNLENHPVSMVSWYGVMAFCTYYGYRLPTEWEWQAVADYKFDGIYLYGCGITMNHEKANYYFRNPVEIQRPYTTPVGYYGEFGYGLCDLAGNVTEMTSSFYYPDDSKIPVGKGGNYDSEDTPCLVANREGIFGKQHMFGWVGFRVCLP